MDAHHQRERMDVQTNRVARKAEARFLLQAALLDWYVIPPAGYAPAARFEPRNMLPALVPPLNSTGTPCVGMLSPNCANMLLSKPLKRGSDMDTG